MRSRMGQYETVGAETFYEGYAKATNTYFMMLKGEQSGVSSYAEAEQIYNTWMEYIAQMAEAGVFTADQANEEIKSASYWYDYAIQRIEQGTPSVQPPMTGGSGLPMYYSQPVTTKSSGGWGTIAMAGLIVIPVGLIALWLLRRK